MVGADLDEVAAIEKENPSPWSIGSLALELAIRRAIQVVAVTETPAAQIVGWCACRVIHPEGELLKIAIREKNRECGAGHFLLEYLCRELKKRKVTSLFLEVRSRNRTALKFYEKHGFLTVATRSGYYTDPPDTAMILNKSLSL
jgi:ribosomal-protein-alanine acetyltransferase